MCTEHSLRAAGWRPLFWQRRIQDTDCYASLSSIIIFVPWGSDSTPLTFSFLWCSKKPFTALTKSLPLLSCDVTSETRCVMSGIPAQTHSPLCSTHSAVQDTLNSTVILSFTSELQLHGYQWQILEICSLNLLKRPPLKTQLLICESQPLPSNWRPCFSSHFTLVHLSSCCHRDLSNTNIWPKLSSILITTFFSGQSCSLSTNTITSWCFSIHGDGQ
jgi:hypothetical protein